MICVACGMQSQDFINESFDVMEGMEVTQVGGKMRYKKSHQDKNYGKKENIDEPETIDFLSIYQHCLQLITDSVVKASARAFDGGSATSSAAYPSSSSESHSRNNGSSSSSNRRRSNSNSNTPHNSHNPNNSHENVKEIESLSCVVRELWSQYLQAWSSSTHNISDVFSITGGSSHNPYGSNNKNDSGKNRKNSENEDSSTKNNDRNSSTSSGKKSSRSSQNRNKNGDTEGDDDDDDDDDDGIENNDANEKQSKGQRDDSSRKYYTSQKSANRESSEHPLYPSKPLLLGESNKLHLLPLLLVFRGFRRIFVVEML